MFFKSRKAMRQFKGSAKKVDQGAKAQQGRRWAVQVS